MARDNFSQDNFLQYIGNPWMVPLVPDDDMQGVRLNWDSQYGNFEFGDSFRGDVGYMLFVRYENSNDMLIVCTGFARKISAYLVQIADEPDKDAQTKAAILEIAAAMNAEAGRIEALNAAWRGRGCPAHRIDSIGTKILGNA